MVKTGCYELIEWPEIQDYMDYENFKEEVGFDPGKMCGMFQNGQLMIKNQSWKV